MTQDEEICEFCGYRHSEHKELAEAYHRARSLPFKLVEGRIKTDDKHQCAGCERRISTSYKYCINCARTKG